MESKCLEIRNSEGMLVGSGEFHLTPITRVTAYLRPNPKANVEKKEYPTLKDLIDDIGSDHTIKIRDFDEPKDMTNWGRSRAN